MIAYEDAAVRSTGSPRVRISRAGKPTLHRRERNRRHAELELGGEVVMLATPNREYQRAQDTIARHATQRAGGLTPVGD